MNITPVSELLGSTPAETAEVKDKFKLNIKTFKGAVLRMSFEYQPYEGEPRLCNAMCGNQAEHMEITAADPYYARYLCAPCRDKAAAPKKAKEERPIKYVRYAGHSRKKHSYTLTEYEKLMQDLKEQDEQNRGNAGGESTSPVTSTPGSTQEGERIDSTTG